MLARAERQIGPERRHGAARLLRKWAVSLPANLAPEYRAAEAAYRRALLIASKADRLADPESDLQLRAFPEPEALDCQALAASAETGFGPGAIGP